MKTKSAVLIGIGVVASILAMTFLANKYMVAAKNFNMAVRSTTEHRSAPKQPVARELKYGLKKDVAIYDAYITGEEAHLTMSMAVVGVVVPGHPEIQTVLVDCMLVSDCHLYLQMMRISKQKVKIHGDQIEYITGQSSMIWIVEP